MQRIIIEGNIGAGKTTLAQMLAKEFHVPLLLEEFADNPLLPKFYKDGDRYSFPLEVSFLLARVKQWKDADTYIADYCMEKCLLFGQQTLEENEFELFRELFTALRPRHPQPDILIFLDAEVPLLQTHIRKRGRPYELNIPDKYLAGLEYAYEAFFEGWNQSRKLRINTMSLDFEHDPEAFTRILEAIKHPGTEILA